MSDRRRALVDFARRSIGRGSKSFALASRLFEPAVRERVWMLYAWCRHCDDVVDGQVGGYHVRPGEGDILARVEALRQATRAAFDVVVRLASSAATVERLASSATTAWRRMLVRCGA